MIRFLSALAISLCALSVQAKDMVVLCEKTGDQASELAFDKAVEDFMAQGYELENVGTTVKKPKKTFVGTGLRLGMGPKGRRVIAMGALSGSPSAQTGMFATRAYNITSIDGVSSVDMEVTEARKLILGDGKAGTGVVLELMRYNVAPGEERAYTRYIERQPVTIPVETMCMKLKLTKK